jgi:hypothetical protein
MIKKINKEIAEWFLDIVDNKGIKEFDMNEYHFIFRYAHVEYGMLYMEEEETKDIKKFRDYLVKSYDDVQFKVDDLNFDVTNLDKEYVTEMVIDLTSEVMYIIPDRAKSVTGPFLRTISDYILMGKEVSPASE